MPDYLRIGHRGAAAYALENSRLSIELALEMGVDMVEFDVRRCRDGLVLIHDSDLKRIIGRREKVKDMTVAKLKALIAEGTESRKAWKAQRQNRNRRGSERVAEEILTLEEALALIKERYSRPLIDFKETGCEEEILRTLADFGLEDGAILSSVRAEALRRVKALNPNLKTAIAYPEDRWNISQKRFMAPFVEAFVLLLKLLMPLRVRLLAEEADVAALYYKVLSPPVVEIAHSRGVEVYAWTVNDRPTLQRMVAMGVDGLVSDRPDLFVDSRQ